MSKKKGILLVVSGPSGCGKGTILKELLSSTGNVFISTSATTRVPRPGEENGIHYYFLTKEQFEQEIQSDGMLEYANYCGNYYGTPKKPVFDRLENGGDVILEIEVQGAMQVQEKYPDAITVFVMPPSVQELERRLADRQTEDEETIRRRLETAQQEMKLACKYKYIVVNDVVSEAAEDMKAILRAEKNNAKHMQMFLANMLQ